ncbi:MAG: hypothetical protein KAY32_04505 [Candidatus Eisenbacteria sp.]|nr:hypothetical protein [Candidatus Eisenbacteria bacterium]
MKARSPQTVRIIAGISSGVTGAVSRIALVLLLGLSLAILWIAALPALPETPGAQAAGPQAQFHSEVIRLLVQPGRLTVNALYRFVAPEEARVRPMLLFFPYPQDSLLGQAEMAMLEVAPPDGNWHPAGFTESPDGRGARWRIPLPADTTLVRAVYHQALYAEYARYIVTTTSVWDRPLVHARFEIFLPESARAPEFSFPFQAPDEPGAPYVYEEENFLPDRDITVTWSW